MQPGKRIFIVKVLEQQ
ncbi:hypothetical protein [Vibrio barjaei]